MMLLLKPSTTSTNKKNPNMKEIGKTLTDTEKDNSSTTVELYMKEK